MSRRKRVYLHVGVPKSGTTFLQAMLADNRERLSADGVLYPTGKHQLMFRAALDVRGNHNAWGRTREEVQGSWETVCRRAQEYDGTTLISHELLAAAAPRQIEAALALLAGLDVHVVVTARDPARQVVAEWQEGVKHGRTWTFDQFVAAVLGEAGHPYAVRFAAAQDLPDVLARWSAHVGPEHVHVVCCPPPQQDPSELWRLFAGVVGLDPHRYEVADIRARNTSLGVVQIDLLRRVNDALDGRLVQPEYGRVVKRYFAQQLLAAQLSRRPELPGDRYDELARTARRWQREIRDAGYAVHGDLERLLPVAPTAARTHPDYVDLTAEADTAAAVIADLLVELERSQRQAARLEPERGASAPPHEQMLKRGRRLLTRRPVPPRAG